MENTLIIPKVFALPKTKQNAEKASKHQKHQGGPHLQWPQTDLPPSQPSDAAALSEALFAAPVSPAQSGGASRGAAHGA